MDKKKCIVSILLDGDVKRITSELGSVFMDIFHKNNIYIEAPCGGKGICGKCKVKLLRGSVSEMTKLESSFLSQMEKEDGYRLACFTKILGDVEIAIEGQLEGAQILSTGLEYFVDISPKISKKFVQLDRPTVDNQRDDLDRLIDSLGIDNPHIHISLLRELAQILRSSDFKATITYDGNQILDVEKGNESKKSYGLAIDIGTTTVVCYLIDLITGQQIDIISGLNAQRPYGGDVISRIQYTMEEDDGLSRLRGAIVEQLSEFIHELAYRNHISINHIYNILIAGNTIMGHLLLGIDPQHIAASPFTPVVTQAQVYPASQLGLKLGRGSRVFILPHISGYVGADVVAGVLASGMDRREELSLILDIGTNGEIVWVIRRN